MIAEEKVSPWGFVYGALLGFFLGVLLERGEVPKNVGERLANLERRVELLAKHVQVAMPGLPGD